jgi:hypothetical protein
MSEVRGQREPDGAPHTLYDSPPGAYAKWPVTASGETFTAWVFKCPGCGGLGTLSYDTRKGAVHEVDENADGTITVEPKPGNSNSILHDCGWHGYIDHDTWRPA